MSTSGAATAPRQVTLEEVKKWSDEELRTAVAKLDGWQIQGDEWIGPENHDALGFRDDDGCWHDIPPDYPHDLNAVHEAEKGLNLQQQHDYATLIVQRLRDEEDIALGEKPGRTWPLNGFGYFALLNLSPRQRCEALVLCLSTSASRSLSPVENSTAGASVLP